MKTRATAYQQGHTIMITLVVCLVLGVILLGIIKLANNEGQMTGRSQNWNAVMPIVEAGIEEAFTHLKHSPSNRAENGWTFDTSITPPVYTKTRTFQDGYYTVTISTNWDPVIISRAGIRAPLQTEYSIFRKVRVQATNQPLWTAAIEALQCVELSGNGINFNSYNSLDPNFSGPGGIYDPNKVKAGGDVACYGGVNSLDIGNANIAGSIKTGPDGSFEMGPNATVGDLLWTGTGTSGVQSGQYEQVENTDWPPMTPPIGGTTPPAGQGDDRGYQYVLTNGFYEVKQITGEIKVTGKATLLVTDRLQLKNAVIEPNAQLILYVAAKSADIAGVANQSTDALHFIYFGMPSNENISMGGNSAFTGVLYAPNAYLILNGGGANAVDFSGAIIAKCVKVTGHYSFHFDEAVRRFGSKGMIASSWDELSPEPSL
jgi:hypothetical protein